MINTYFKSNGKLIRVEVPTDNHSIAQVEAQMLATSEKIEVDSPILAVIPKDKSK